jgi:ATP-dependent RNA helicase DDX54/DBP10
MRIAFCRLKTHAGGLGARATFLAPARELALQTYKVITEIARFTDLRTAVLVGGDSIQAQFAELAACPDVLVATPGRLLHHLQEVPGFDLRQVKHVVLDEADRLFEMGLGSQVRTCSTCSHWLVGRKHGCP